MKIWSERTIRRIQALSDVAAMSGAFVLAVTLRHGRDLAAWQSQIYMTALLFNLLIYIFLYLMKRLRQERNNLWISDAFDVMAQVLKERFIQYVLLIVLLTLSHNFQRISRLALLYVVIFDVAITYVLRLCLRYLVRRHRAAAQVKEHYVIVTTRAEASVAHARMEEILPEDADIAGFLYVDPLRGADALGKILEMSLSPGPESGSALPGEQSASSYYEIHCTVDYMAGVRRGHVKAEELPVLTYLPEAAHVFVYLSREKEAAASDRIVRFYRDHNVPVSVRIFLQGGELPRSVILDRGTHATADYTNFAVDSEVLGVRFVVSDVERAAFEVMDVVTQGMHSESEAGSGDVSLVDSGSSGRTQRVSVDGVGCAGEDAAMEQPSADKSSLSWKDESSCGEGKSGSDTPCACGNAGALSGEYICFSNVHTTVVAHDDPSFREVLNGSAYTFADGTPIARQLSRQGFPMSKRVAGPDFMDAIFRATMDGSVSHYFYGSTQETIDKLCEELPKRYPGIRIAGAVSPPFRPETEEEDAASVEAMNASGAAFIWIGLGAPKQEKWMAAHRGRVCGVMLGVGAGFNFYAGTVKRAPKWIQKIGMEWFYRLIQDPKRLANRYIVTNLKFLWYMLRGREGG